MATATALLSPVRHDVLGRRVVVLGRSVDNRQIIAVESGDFDSPNKALIVGCIHGDERAGLAIAVRLTKAPPPSESDLWVIPDLNPDGAAADSRGNAHNVDLHRNFPWRWRRLRGLFYSGTRPLSEPESRIAYQLIERIRPHLSIWFHQHLDVVDESGGNTTVERRFAALVGLPLARLTREPGSAVGWTNHVAPSGTAFVVELPGGAPSATAASRYATAVLTLTASARDGR